MVLRNKNGRIQCGMKIIFVNNVIKTTGKNFTLPLKTDTISLSIFNYTQLIKYLAIKVKAVS